MAAIVELHPGDVLVVRRTHLDPPTDDERDSMRNIVDDLELGGIIYLGPGEDLNVWKMSNESLAELGLQRIRTD